MAAAFYMFQLEALAIGLSINVNKCELITSSAQDIDTSLFPSNIQLITDGNLEYLGAPIGSPEFCNDYTKSKVVKLKPLFNAIAEIEEPQVSYLLLKNCSSYGKMVYSARTTPHDWHSAALAAFDYEVRFCFEQSTGIHSTDL